MPDQFTSIAPFYDELMDLVPYRKWVNYILKICKRHHHIPHKVLDCACGTGNVTWELARRKLNVTGVDISQGMLDVALHKSTFTDIVPHFFLADLCEMNLSEQFDTVTCLYDSLNYLTTPQHLKQAFTRIRHHLLPGGLFIFDINSPYAFETDMFTQSGHNSSHKLRYNWIAHFDRHTHLCTVDMSYTRQMEDGSRTFFQETHCERSYSMKEVTQLLQETGWNLLECFDSYRLEPPHPHSERWFFVATPQHESTIAHSRSMPGSDQIDET